MRGHPGQKQQKAGCLWIIDARRLLLLALRFLGTIDAAPAVGTQQALLRRMASAQSSDTDYALLGADQLQYQQSRSFYCP